MTPITTAVVGLHRASHFEGETHVWNEGIELPREYMYVQYDSDYGTLVRHVPVVDSEAPFQRCDGSW